MSKINWKILIYHNIIREMRKLVSKNKLLKIIKEMKRCGKKIVFTNGCFDIIHAGHVRYLQRAKKYGDLLIVGLNSDTSVKKIKGKTRPINNQNDRAEVLSALDCVDFVTIFNEETPEKLIQDIKPDVLVKGADWKGKRIAGEDIVLAKGGRVVFLPYLKGRSTTEIIQRIKKS